MSGIRPSMATRPFGHHPPAGMPASRAASRAARSTPACPPVTICSGRTRSAADSFWMELGLACETFTRSSQSALLYCNIISMPRLFVAIDLDPEQASSLASLRDDSLNARWMPEHQYHLTLRFVGEANDEIADRLAGALTEIRGAAFELSSIGVDVFPSRRRPRVLVVRVAPNPELIRIQTSIDQLVVDLGMPEHQYQLTLRFVGEANDEIADRLAGALTEIRGAAFELSSIGVDVFPSRRRPRVLVVRVAPNPELIRIQTSIDQLVVDLGLP